MYFVYILFSKNSSKFYTGQTKNIDDRIKRHNSGFSLSTKSGIPWELIYQISFFTRTEALIMENKIKKRGKKIS